MPRLEFDTGRELMFHPTNEIALPQADPYSHTVPELKPEPLYNVILLDDDQHTYEYVVEMLVKVFGHPVEESYKMAVEVDHSGRVIVDTTHRERAELKRDQIMCFGADPLINGSRGSMRATIEPQH